MNYCQFRNQTIKRMANAGGATPILPTEYQQVEYLASSGTQYINTGVLNTTPIDYYIELEVTGYVSGGASSSNYIFGTWAPNARFFVAYSGLSLALNIGYDGSYSTGGNVTYNTKHIINGSLKGGTQNLYLDGVRKITQSSTGAIGTQGHVTLYAANYLDGVGITDYSESKVYRLTLESNGQTALDFIPCYRKSDNKPGMYDLVTDTFFINAGTGEFTVGQDV